MSASMAIRPKINPSLKPTNFTSQNLLKTPVLSVKPKSSLLNLSWASSLRVVQSTAKLKLSASAAEPVLSEEETPRDKEVIMYIILFTAEF